MILETDCSPVSGIVKSPDSNGSKSEGRIWMGHLSERGVEGSQKC